MSGEEANRLEAVLHAFTHPRNKPLAAEEQQLLNQAEVQYFNLGWDRFPLWTWGRAANPTRRVLLVHGWESRASHWASFIPALLVAGYEVSAFDGPAHGEADGESTNVLELGQALVVAAKAVGPLFAVIGHSAGSPASLYGFANGVETHTSVHLSGPAHLTHVLDHVAARGGLTKEQWPLFRQRFESYLGVPAETLDLPMLRHGLSHPALLLHDPLDAEVPYAESEALAAAWPEARLEAVADVGHRRILKSPSAIEGVVNFLRQQEQREER